MLSSHLSSTHPKFYDFIGGGISALRGEERVRVQIDRIDCTASQFRVALHTNSFIGLNGRKEGRKRGIDARGRTILWLIGTELSPHPLNQCKVVCLLSFKGTLEILFVILSTSHEVNGSATVSFATHPSSSTSYPPKGAHKC